MRSLLAHIYALIPSQHRPRILSIVFWLSIGAFLDFFSLATFIPVLLLIVDPVKASSHTWITNLSIFTSVANPAQAAIYLTVAALVFILLKTQIQAWITHRKARYAYAIANDLASSALARYLASSYTQFTNTDYTREMNRVSNLPLTFANNIIIPVGTLLSEGLLTLILLAGVAIYNLQVFGLLVLILIPVAWVYRLKKKKIRGISDQVKTNYPQVLKYTLQAIEGWPEIRAFDKGAFFKKRFDETYSRLTKTFSMDHAAHAGTSRVTELIAACCIGALIIYSLLYQASNRDTIILLSVYAGISFRVIPAVNRIFAGVLQIKSHEYVVGELQGMLAPLHQLHREKAEPLHFSRSLELRNLSFRYHEEDRVLEDITLTIGKGEKVIFLGKSGKGKTTLLLVLMQFLKERSGSIVVDGKPLTDGDIPGWRRLLGYVPQSPYILDATIMENIAFGIPPENIDKSKIEQLIRSLDLEPWIKTLEAGLNTVIGEKGLKVSGGQRQRIAIARALYHDAEILLLDEITNQLDRETEREVVQVLDNLAAQQKTIIFITHRPELWKSVDAMYQIQDGLLKKIAVNETSLN